VTMTSNQVSPAVDKPDVDQRPGSSDIAWAERAYHHQEREHAGGRRRVLRPSRRRSRLLTAMFATVLLMAGLVVAMRYVGSAPSPVQRPTSSQAVHAASSATSPSPFTLVPSLERPFPPLPLTINTPAR
jgi:hypothetical protein